MKVVKRNDVILIMFVLALALVLMGVKKLNSVDNNGNAVVYVDNELYASFPLDEDITADICEGESLLCTLTIKNNCADITDASCPDKLCVRQQAISFNNETICCLPNRVLIVIESNEDSKEYDAISK